MAVELWCELGEEEQTGEGLPQCRSSDPQSSLPLLLGVLCCSYRLCHCLAAVFATEEVGVVSGSS